MGVTTGSTVAGLMILIQAVTKQIFNVDLSAEQAAIAAGFITGAFEFVRNHIPWSKTS